MIVDADSGNASLLAQCGKAALVVAGTAALWIGGAAAQPPEKVPPPIDGQAIRPGTDPGILTKPPRGLDPHLATPPPRDVDPEMIERPPADARLSDGTRPSAPSLSPSRQKDCRVAGKDCPPGAAR